MAKILLVDDDRSLADLVQYALQRAGFDVLTVHSGRAALEAVQAQVVDLVVLDVHLPDLNGFAVLSALRALVNVPVVMLTGSTRDEAGMTRREVRPDDYVVKPFSVTMLQKRIDEALKRHRSSGGAAHQSSRPKLA